MMHRIAIALACAVFSIAPAAVAATPAPRIAIATLAELPQPLPLPYRADADAKAEVAAAKLRAAKSGKRLLIDLGGNWCPDCRALAGVMALPSMQRFLARHFEVVIVDVGRFDSNLDIPAHYGIKGRLKGVPAVLVVDPKRDRLLNPGREAALADARAMTPQAIADWFAGWAG